MKKEKIIVIGDLLLDQYWLGKAKRISDEAPVPIVKINNIENRLGGAGNVALNVKKLGFEPYLISINSNDNSGKILKKLLKSFKINNYLFTIKEYITPTKIRIIDKFQQIVRADFEISDNKFSNEIEKKLNSIKNIKVIIISDYSKGTIKDPRKIIKYANKNKIPIIIDPKGKNFQKYNHATLITPNLNEFQQIVGRCLSLKQIHQKGRKLLNKMKLQSLLITKGENGMTLIEKNKKIIDYQSNASQVFDVTGAGDTVVASLATSLAKSASIKDATYISLRAAEIAVSKFGTNYVTKDELKNSLSNLDSLKKGIITLSQLMNNLVELRKNGKKIIATNGCFDILHNGHINYLKKSKKLGDWLIVAVNSDSSYRKLKNKTPLVNSLKARMNLLSSLKFVNNVISFNEVTPKNLYSKILPNIITKGGDYTLSQVVGRKEISKIGGVVKIIPYEKNFSTTLIKNKIRNNK